MSSDNIERLFKTAETEKRLPLSTGAWNRLDDLLEEDNRRTSIFRYSFIGVAASITLLIGAFFIFNSSSNNDYILEQLVIDRSEIMYSSSEVAQLNYQHQSQSLQKLKPFYNQKGEVKATVN